LFKVLTFSLVIAALFLACVKGDNAVQKTETFTVNDLRQEVHWHADFAVFIEGEQLVFNSEEYITTENFTVAEYVHIHKPYYSVVHVHREQTTWSEFFETLGWELSATCLIFDQKKYCSSEDKSLIFYVNDVQVDSITFLEISDLQRVLISYGNPSPKELSRQLGIVGSESCILSELCLDRVPETDDYPEPCSGRSNCN